MGAFRELSVSRVKDILKSVQNFYGSTDCIFVLGIEIWDPNSKLLKKAIRKRSIALLPKRERASNASYIVPYCINCKYMIHI